MADAYETTIQNMTEKLLSALNMKELAEALLKLDWIGYRHR